MSDQKIPKIGIAVIIRKEGKILLGKRRGSHGDGTWAMPGGHLEFKEKIFDCAHREIQEEVGIKIKNLKLGPYTEDYFEREDRHYITIFVISDYESGEVKNLEPNRCESWDWFEYKDMPKNLFSPIINLKLTEFDPFKI